MSEMPSFQPQSAKSKSRGSFAPLVGALMLGIIWEDFCRLLALPSYVLPAPSDLFWSLLIAEHRTLLFEATLQTASAAMLGFAISAIMGVLIGTGLASVRLLRIGVYPLANLLQMVPIIAIAPLLNIWFGYGVWGVAASATIVSIFPVIANTVDGFRSIDPQLVELFEVYGAKASSRWRLLEIPAALPQIFTGLRVAAGLAVIGAVVGELVSGVLKSPPIGAVIAANLRTGKLEIVFSAIACSALVGFILFGIVAWLGSRFMVGLDQESKTQEQELSPQVAQQEKRLLITFFTILTLLTVLAFNQKTTQSTIQNIKKAEQQTKQADPLVKQAQSLKKVSLQLNWVPEPEFGGIYEAKRLGLDKELGLDLQIIAGGPGTPSAQLIAQEKIEFGVVDGTQIMSMRAKGAPIVGIYASFQREPRAMMTHTQHSAKDLKELWHSQGLMAVEPGSLFMRWLTHLYGASALTWVSTSGGLSQFKLDSSLSQAVYVFSEPVSLELEGVRTRLFPIAESGFNPYAVIIATHEKQIQEHPERVKQLDQILRQGWLSYLKDSKPTNRLLSQLNPSMSFEAMELAVKFAKPYIQDTQLELGKMQLERWQTLKDQLLTLKVLSSSEKVDAQACFWKD